MCRLRNRIIAAALIGVVVVLSLWLVPSHAQEEPSPDQELRTLLQMHRITPLDPGPMPDPARVELGRLLFFDTVLGGNRNVSCATCHHPAFATSDALPVSVGTGAVGLGPARLQSEHVELIPRHAPDLFNRGAPEWRTMFWDSRVEQHPDGSFTTPAGAALPPGLESVLAVQAMFPVANDAEMRGFPGDHDVYGQPNELAPLAEDDFTAIWDGLMQRLLAIPEYQERFHTVYPDVPADELGFQHAANAIAAFTIAEFTLLNSPWDRYVAGDTTALSESARRGALLFYSDAGCINCHTGNLLTDQEHHNIAVPQVGPGKGTEAPGDFGRARETGIQGERFAFRTPPLRNVALTSPYMHDGAFKTLEASVRHYIVPDESLRTYNVAEHLPPELHATFQNDPVLLDEMLLLMDPLTLPPADLTDQDVADLVAFLEALTDPAATQLEHVIPASVPSGLPVEVAAPAPAPQPKAVAGPAPAILRDDIRDTVDTIREMLGEGG